MTKVLVGEQIKYYEKRIEATSGNALGKCG
jgi:hypothetical protein